MRPGPVRASHYRARGPTVRPAGTQSHRHRALEPAEVDEVIEALNSERFCDKAPAQVWATLLDEGTYLASVSTMYRLLRDRAQVRERRAQARRPALVKPELVATAPTRCGAGTSPSWPVPTSGPGSSSTRSSTSTPLRVGWLVAPKESATLAEQLIADAIYRHEVPYGQLTLHADRGTSMTSRTVSQLLADLGVLQSHSRPHSVQRQPLLRGPVQDAQVLAHIPQRFTTIDAARAF